MMQFKKAVKHEAKLRMALIGPAGSGKTYTALSIGQHLGSRIALLDTEHGSASKYADIFTFDALAPDTFSPTVYIEAIQIAEQGGYDVLILDSLSHAWAGKGGLLEFVDEQAKKSRSGNTFAAWREATPLHNRLIDTMLACNLHLIVTMRSKMEYVVEQDERGKTTVRKVGMQPVQRDGLEYEFDVTADLDLDNNLIVSKTRCPDVKGRMFARAGKDVADILKIWLVGVPVPPALSKRDKLVARLVELAGQANKVVDQDWLTGATEDDIVAEGKSLAELVKKSNGKTAEPVEQSEMPLDEAA